MPPYDIITLLLHSNFTEKSIFNNGFKQDMMKIQQWLTFC